MTDGMVTGYDKTKVGEQTLTVTYEGQTATFKVTVTNNITGIEVKSAPSKLTYIKGENLDVSGGEITLTYQNRTTKNIMMIEDMVTGYDKTKVGEQTLTVTYSGKTATFKVTVIELHEELEVTIPEKYDVNEEKGYIEEIYPETTVKDLGITTNGTMEIYNGETKLGNDDIVGTGSIVRITKGEETKEYTLVVIGDLFGNGKMENRDLLKLARYIVKLDTDLEGAYLKAANVYKDEINGDNRDLLKMARVIVGLDTLE